MGQSWAARVVAAVVAVVGLTWAGTVPTATATAATVALPGVRAVVAPERAVSSGTSEAVSCPAVGACIGVGTTTVDMPEPTVVPVAYQQTDSSWRVTALPLPSGLTVSNLGAVSCPTTTWCLALGHGTEANGNAAGFTETDDSGTWTVAAAPPGLGQVSCSAPGTCMAAADGTSAQLVGGAWQTEGAPADAFFAGLSCARGGTCVAVGGDTVYRQDGGSWTPEELTASAGTTNLLGVACPTATSCTAVGYNLNGRAYTAVVVAITPTAATSTPLTGADAPAELTGVTCAGADWCYADDNIPNATTAVILSGGGWISSDYNYDGLSCPAANRCVGPFGSGAFYVVDRSGKWLLQTVPVAQAPAATVLSGVSCWGAGQCVAGGSTYEPFDSAPMVMNRGSGQWAPTVFNNGNLIPGELDAVACTPAQRCVAVGVEVVATTPGTGHWSATPLPADSKVPGISLSAVSCWAWLQCVAVGSSTSGPGRPVIEQLSSTNGFQPTLLSLPANDGKATLTSVSCTSATRCAAVGSVTVGKSTRPLVAWTSGGTWQHESLGSGVLDAVSCPPSGSCVAVGTRTGHDMVASQQGSGWKATVSSVPTHAPPTTVSCPARGVCWSTANTGGDSLELVSVSPTNARAVRAIDETGEYTASLTGISCPTTASCAVVGTGYGPRGSVGLVGLFDPS